MARIIDGNEMNLVGDQVRALRIGKGMSQQALAEKLEALSVHVCRGSISRLEDKLRTVTDMELYGLAQVLDVPVDALFSGREELEGRTLD